MAARGEQDEQLLAGPSAASAGPDFTPGPEGGSAEGEPSPWRPARARAVVAALVACAVLAALAAVGSGAAARALAQRGRAAARQVEAGPGALGSTVSLALSAQDYTEMLDGLNQYRMSKGLRTLCYNEKLNEAAQMHADDMNEREFCGHVGSDGSLPDDRAASVGYDFFQTVGENYLLGPGDTAVPDVLRRMIKEVHGTYNVHFNDWSHFGFAKSGIYWEALFAVPKGKEACMQTGGGADGHGGLCRDFVPAGESSWHDSDGEACSWYAIGNHCEDHGHLYKNFGHTANTACCACGRVEGGGCMDLVPDGWKVWYDSLFKRQCDSYSVDLCESSGGSWPNEGLTARMACCVCGGGRTLSEEPTSDFLPAPAPSPGLGCDFDCQDSAECHSTLFCCPMRNICMDLVTLSVFGPNCDKVEEYYYD